MAKAIDNKVLSSLSVFFPVFNEEKNLVSLIEETDESIKSVAEKYELIIVNDGSNDASLEIATKLAKQFAHLKIVNHEKNLGYGAALKSGITAAQYEWTFFTDADLQFDIQQLKDFLPFVTENEVIIGFRKNRAEGLLRSLNARLFKTYIDVLFRLHVKDIDCAFKLFKTSTVQAIELESSGAFTTSELLYKLKKKGIKFQQVPVDHYKRRYGKPTGAALKVIIKGVWEAFFLYVKIKIKSIFHK